jgi:NADH dehydrogenase (ubiquinone) 1 alpha subcomplex subunit 9
MAALTGQMLRIGRQHGQHGSLRTVSVLYSQQREESVFRGQTSNLAAYKRGRGGRSSFSGIVATVLGASGFTGRYVVNRLGKMGSQVICPYRGDPYYMKDLRLAGDLGQILFMPYDLQDEASLRKVMKYSNVVINLVGREWETRNYSFNKVHVDGAARIARIAKEMGVEKFVHMSHLNAAPSLNSIFVDGGSQYLISKHLGELAVREAFPEAIVFRPADIYGPEDRFIRYYINRWRRFNGNVPLWKRGTETVKMPVFVSDVAEGIMNAIQDPDALGQTYEAVGPSSYELGELVQFFYRCMRHQTNKVSNMNPLYKVKVNFMSYAPSYPVLTMDKLDREHQSDILTGTLPTLQDLGVKLTRVEDRVPFELKPFRRFGYYEEKLGEWPAPEPPQALV